MHQENQHEFVTNQGSLSVTRCHCGAIQIRLGGVSLKLAQDAASYLQEAIAEALGVTPKVENSAKYLIPVA